MKVMSAIITVCIVFTLTGCTILKTYKSTGMSNMKILSQSSSGIKTSLHLHDVNKNCQIKYIGTIKLDSKIMQAGIPVNKYIYIEVEFYTSSFLAMNDKVTNYGIFIKPRKNYVYMLKSHYIDNVYDVTLHNKKRSSKKYYELPVQGLKNCKQI